MEQLEKCLKITRIFRLHSYSYSQLKCTEVIIQYIIVPTALQPIWLGILQPILPWLIPTPQPHGYLSLAWHKLA